MKKQLELIESPLLPNQYRPVLTAVENEKGVLDVDSVKGCSHGVGRYGSAGCYGECYAKKIAARYGIAFEKSVSRLLTSKTKWRVFKVVKEHPASWYRMGVSGDPSYDWENTSEVCEFLQKTGKVPVIITKHWNEMGAQIGHRLAECGAVVNTSISATDSKQDMDWRLDQFHTVKTYGIKSVLRVVTCEFGDTENGRRMKNIQDFLLSHSPVIDNPLRASKQNPLAVSGDIKLKTVKHAIGGGKLLSLHDDNVYTGRCKECPDQCGVTM